MKMELNERQEVIKWEADEVKKNIDKMKILTEFENVLEIVS